MDPGPVTSRVAAGLTALALVVGAAAAQSGSTDESRPSRYPYDFVPVDAYYTHLLEGPLGQPRGVFYEPGEGLLYVSDARKGLIGLFNDGGSEVFAFGRAPLLVEPREIFVDPEGTIFVLDDAKSAVEVFSYRGESLGSVAFEYPALDGLPGGTARVGSFARTPEGGWAVGDLDVPQVLVFGPDLELRFAIRTRRAAGRIESVADVAVSSEGFIAVVDYLATPVQVFDPRGRFLAGWGRRDVGVENFTQPVACEFDEQGYLFVVDLLRHDIKVFEPNGAFRGIFGGWFGPQTRGRGAGELSYPVDLTFEPDGGRVFVAERFGRRVQVFERHLRAPEPEAPPRRDTRRRR